MPAVIDTQRMTIPNRMFLKRDEIIQPDERGLLGLVKSLRARKLDQIVITNASAKTLTLRRDGATNIERVGVLNVADTTWGQTNMVVNIAGHNLIRLQHALENWGVTTAEYLLDVPGSPINTIRFTLSGNVSI